MTQANYIALQLRAEQHSLRRLLNLGFICASEFRRCYSKLEAQLELVGGAS